MCVVSVKRTATKVAEGVPLNLSVNTSGDCANKIVALTVRESSPVGADLDVTTNPTPAQVISGVASATWTAEYVSDLTRIGGDPQFYFLARFIGDTNIVRSQDPTVTVTKATTASPTPAPTQDNSGNNNNNNGNNGNNN